jgi:hypothetical protein
MIVGFGSGDGLDKSGPGYLFFLVFPSCSSLCVNAISSILCHLIDVQGGKKRDRERAQALN